MVVVGASAGDGIGLTIDNDKLIAIDLNEDERDLLVMAINEYDGTAQGAVELLPPLIGKSSRREWRDYTRQLMENIERREPLSNLDWARALLLTEFGFGSDMVANARRFGPVRDEYWVLVLRSLQDRVSTDERARLLQENARFPAFDSPNDERTSILPMDLGPFEFDDDERRLMLMTLNAYTESPRRGFGLLAPIAGQASFDEWAAYVAYLHHAVAGEQPLVELDWARVLLLTEMGFISSLVGFAPQFRGADERGIVTLRSLQRTIRRGPLSLLFIENATYRWIRHDEER
jgi:hypothetical protein